MVKFENIVLISHRKGKVYEHLNTWQLVPPTMTKTENTSYTTKVHFFSYSFEAVFSFVLKKFFFFFVNNFVTCEKYSQLYPYNTYI